MITITFDHPLQQAQVFFVDTHQTVLVDDEDSLTIADIEQCWCHGVMRGTVGVNAILFQLFDAPSLQSIGDGSAHTSMILMQVDTFQFQRLSVEEEALLRIKGDITDTCCREVNIRHLSILRDGGLHLIEIRIGGTPEMGIVDDELLLATCCLLRL